MRFTTILVSTDLSALGDAAIPLAFELAEQHGARVTIAHVLDGTELPNPMYAHYARSPTPQQLRRMRHIARSELAARVPRDARRVRSSFVVGTGTPADELCRTAAKLRASLFVISSHGRTGLRRLLIGSVAESVVRRAACSILLLRHPASTLTSASLTTSRKRSRAMR